METADLTTFPISSNSENGNEHIDTCESGSEAIISDSIPRTSEVVENRNETPGAVSDCLNENMDSLMTTESENLADSNTTALQFDLEMTNSVAEVETMTSISSVHAENGSVPVQSEVSFINREKNETFSSKREVDASSLSGHKRPRVAVDEQQPSVHVTYTSLPRESKQKLEKLLEQWSQWHSQRFSSSKDKKLVLECGEKTYFPALRIGLDNPSTVTFWVDNQTTIQSSKEFVPLDSTSVPLYDRGYSLALTSTDASGLDGGAEKLDTSRCFNCGSYNHALRDCTKPRDNAAVNNARKEQRSKRNQQANARTSTRYYQTSRGGKYDGLTPGVLDVETRRLLGLGELDPPPWLNRMREIGYPPGYLDVDMEELPSGITIFGDDETAKDENEEGEILDAGQTKPSRKMTVKFPGINAPIPENADERLWAPPSSDSTRHDSHRRHSHSSENSSRGRPSEQRWSSERRWTDEQRWSSERRWTSEQRWSSEQWRARDFDDDGPPGCDPGSSPSLAYHFSRYGDIESGRSWSPSSSLGRSWSDRGRRSPLIQDDSPRHGYYGSFPHYSPPR